jgi:hypothetical protein
MEQVNKGVPYSAACVPIMTPFEQINNSGIYEINCDKGHKSKTIIDNINFEILFEYGLNAIADGYYREAVSSFTASMERYFEFFIKTVLRASDIDFFTVDKIWKHINNQSERQLGAYITMYSQTFREEPILLNANKDVPFRNSVIHKGYIPSKWEAVDFGSSVMKIIEQSLINLKNKYADLTNESFDYYGYERTAEQSIKQLERVQKKEINFACVNIMTTINVKHGREIDGNDNRIGEIDQLIPKILDRRIPRQLSILKIQP